MEIRFTQMHAGKFSLSAIGVHLRPPSFSAPFFAPFARFVGISRFPVFLTRFSLRISFALFARFAPSR
jgi:hypothetical protein